MSSKRSMSSGKRSRTSRRLLDKSSKAYCSDDSSDDDFDLGIAALSKRRVVAPKSGGGEPDASEALDEFKRMMKEKKKKDARLKKVETAEIEKDKEIECSAKLILEAGQAAQGDESSDENDEFLYFGLVSGFRKVDQRKESCLQKSVNDDAHWDNLRKLLNHEQNVDAVLSSRLPARISFQHKLACPKDILLWLVDLSQFGACPKPQFDALVNICALLAGCPDYFPVENERLSRSLRTLVGGSVTMPAWKPTLEFFSERLRLAGYSTEHVQWVPEDDSNAKVADSASDYPISGNVESLIQLLDVCLLREHVQFDKDSTKSFTVQLCLLVNDVWFQRFQCGYILEVLLQHIPEPIWASEGFLKDIFNRVCDTLINCKMDMDLQEFKQPEQEKALRIAIALTNIANRSPANTARGTQFRNAVCLAILQCSTITSKIPIFMDPPGENKEKLGDLVSKQVVSVEQWFDIATMLIDRLKHYIVERNREAKKKSAGGEISGVDFRILIVGLKMVHQMLMGLEGETEKGTKRRKETIYTQLTKLFQSLPNYASQTVLLRYTVEYMNQLTQKYKAFAGANTITGNADRSKQTSLSAFLKKD
uniref:Uncharacterized protein n=1 Tax=Mucochytrium quahogii TaxID=96639 RepID=A0A7S2WDJ2_9STRA|mmetsp:Transcript_36484/g.58755  ORF Transcript_36484/g.58755 Transcript_36484/m.58755 type:complete len:593 (+) Transcript_36484:1817-3595(+)